jgi:hypothetical protein
MSLVGIPAVLSLLAVGNCGVGGVGFNGETLILGFMKFVNLIQKLK